MKAILLIICLCSCLLSRAAEVLGSSQFYRINATQFGIYSNFHSGSGACWPFQTRYEHVRNDTLFLELIFETRLASNGFGCGRTDTMTQTNFDAAIHYVNVSTGIIKFDTTNQNVGDTLWNMFDSTFNALAGLPELQTNNLQLFYSQNHLKVESFQAIEQVELIDLNGQVLLLQEGNDLDVSALKPGIYLLRVVSTSGGVKTIRWYRE